MIILFRVNSIISVISRVLCGIWLLSVVSIGVLIVMFRVYREISRLVEGREMLRLVVMVGISLMMMNLVVLMVYVLSVSVSRVRGMLWDMVDYWWEERLCSLCVVFVLKKWFLC